MSELSPSPLEKRCCSCHETKLRAEFWNNKSKADGLYSCCKLCAASYHRKKARQYDSTNREDTPVRRWAQSTYYRTKSRSKLKGYQHNLTVEYLVSIAPTECPVFGFPLIYDSAEPNAANIASIDRKNSAEGYTCDNVSIISRHANVIKSNLTPDEIGRIIEWMSSRSI